MVNKWQDEAGWDHEPCWDTLAQDQSSYSILVSLYKTEHTYQA